MASCFLIGDNDVIEELTTLEKVQIYGLEYLRDH
jgi:hypothetical protein